MTLVGLRHKADIPVSSKRARLSGGQQKRLSLAIALVQLRPVLVLDELTSGLDFPRARELMMVLHTLCERVKLTVISVIHQPSPAIFENCGV